VREEAVALTLAGVYGRHFVRDRRRDLKGYREDDGTLEVPWLLDLLGDKKCRWLGARGFER